MKIDEKKLKEKAKPMNKKSRYERIMSKLGEAETIGSLVELGKNELIFIIKAPH